MDILFIHKLSVWVFLLIYLIKTFLLLSNKNTQLDHFTKVIKVPEMIVSTLFLITGIYQFYVLGALKMMQVIKLIAIFTAIPLAIVGFKNKKKMLGALSMILLILAYGFAEMAKKQKAMGTAEVVSGDGKSVYSANCVLCHGEDGSKGYNNATNLKLSALNKTEIIQVVLQGRGGMPAQNVSETDAEAVAEYIHTLRN